MSQRDALSDLLNKTSRTFALTIPLLAEPTRHEVSVAYLLFRIADTFEDGVLWAPERKIEALDQFVHLLRDPLDEDAQAVAGSWRRDPPLEHEGYLELLEQAPAVLRMHAALAPAARMLITEHLSRTARGMAEFVSRMSPNGTLCLTSLAELRDYCFTVAGIVGELLTELYFLGNPSLSSVMHQLRERSIRFGEGLQLVNILKDVRSDAQEGRIYLPRQLALTDVFLLARRDLTAALEYCELLRSGQAHLGVVAFNTLNARLALATLLVLQEQGSGSKLTRRQLDDLAGDVMRSIQAGSSLHPEPRESA